MPVCCLFSTLSVALEYDREIIGLRTFALLQLQLDLILIKETESQLPYLAKLKQRRRAGIMKKRNVRRGKFGIHR